MLRQLIGTTATTILARQLGAAAAGPTGAMVGVALPFVARRLGPFGIVAMAVAAWAIARLLEDQAKRDAAAGLAVTEVE